MLKCINNQTKRFHTFESIRLTVIHSKTDLLEWNYTNREENPADDGSKGMKVNLMIQNDRWLTGPKFLKESESEWPRLQGIRMSTDEDPQVRKETQIYVVSVRDNGLDDLISFYSNWWKLKRAVGWWLRYRHYLQCKAQGRSNTTSYEHQRRCFGYLTLSELEVAEREILKRVHLITFPAVFPLLFNSNRPAATTKKILRKAVTSIHQLSPILKEGLLCVGGDWIMPK